jgi:succinate dehydrogenase / fumarate reductase membrane anchor subunit
VKVAMLIELLTDRYPGMRQWLTQRLSAVVMALYTIVFVVLIAVQQPSDYVGWLAFFSPWWWRIATILCWFSLMMHAWLGVRDVLKDYIFNVTVRFYLQLLVEVALIVDFTWMAFILIEMK